jgi:hypothetical protein
MDRRLRWLYFWFWIRVLANATSSMIYIHKFAMSDILSSRKHGNR